ncbi:MAG: HDOD domain-containing protein [Deltaproteobacteria bacterium]|nr:HDOD domain-containing protein [Deltaproteobacteria bacterium]
MTLTLSAVSERLLNSTLPSFPQVVLQVERELAKPDAAVGAVAALVEQDPPLAARFLALANSSFYSRGNPTSSALQAVSRLGLAEARQVVLATALLQSFGSLGGADPHRYWTHSVTTALLTRELAKLCSSTLSRGLVDAAYLAGLLHDIGALALAHLFPEEYQPVIDALEESGRPAWEVELDLLGFHHGEVGELLVHGWGLPPAVCASVRFHHEPWSAPQPIIQLVRLVYLSDFVSSNQGFERHQGNLSQDFEAGAWDGLGYTIEQVQEILAQALALGTRSEGLWSFAK